jgi:hypothetical protein
MNFETESRRRFLLRSGNGVGAMALSTLINPSLIGSLNANEQNRSHPGLPQFPNFAPKAKKIIYLFMAGGPSHIDTFDYKPEMRKFHGEELTRLRPPGPAFNWNDKWAKVISLCRSNVSV